MSKQYLTTTSTTHPSKTNIFSLATTPTSLLSVSGSSSLHVHTLSSPPQSNDPTAIDTSTPSDTEPYAVIQTFEKAHPLGCHHVASSADGRRAVSVGFGGEVKIWRSDVQSLPTENSNDDGSSVGKWSLEGRVRSATKKAGEIWAVDLSSEAQYLASSSIDGRVNVWDLDADTSDDPSSSPRKSKNNKTDDDGSEKSIGVKIREYPTRSGFGMCITLSGDGLLTAMGSSTGHVSILSNTTGRAINHHSTGATSLGVSAIRAVKFSPHNSLLAAAGDAKVVALYAVGNGGQGEEVGLLRGHQGWVFALDWNADGTLLASGGWGGNVRVWDVETRQCVWSGRGVEEGVVWSLKWLPIAGKGANKQKGQGFAVGGESGQLNYFREGGAG